MRHFSFNKFGVISEKIGNLGKIINEINYWSNFWSRFICVNGGKKKNILM